MIELEDARRLSPAAQEVVRLRVVAALEAGQVRTYRQAAEVFGVCERSVGTWWRKYKAAGGASLVAPVKSCSGAGEVVSAEERAVLFQAMANYTPEQLLIGGPLWTRATVAELIRMVAGHTMTEQAVGKWLRRHGFTPQRPDRQSHRQDQAKVNAWLSNEYPAIAARAAEIAQVAWADQCGLRSDTAPARTFLGAEGPDTTRPGQRTPVQGQHHVRDHLLDRFIREASRKVHVIADRHPVHRSKAVRAWLAENADRVELHLMPGYSPELNPDENLKADIKRHVYASRARSVDGLARESRRFLHRRQRQPTIVRGYFHVRYTIQ
ncbi:transposase [Streptomyces yunnanensis]|uniref:Transposase n=1 Tax=Streptomyces yunnanensis TaxID=156453 RepID=A0A9X8N8Y0_9ACTN|nr:transposase [Streptomyces yunnanensis]SHN30765.1 Transposase [Streptomyces yunnanensis]